MSKAPRPKSAPKRARRPRAATASRPDKRSVTLGLGAFVAGTVAVLVAVYAGARRKQPAATPAETQAESAASAPVTDDAEPAPSPEHTPVDLGVDGDPGAGGRAPDAFRPDPTAPVPPELRESLRPATGPGPTLSGGDSVVSTFGDD